MANTINPQLLDQFERQAARHEPIRLLTAYVLKTRDNDPERPWNWCDACRLEVPARRQHDQLARCDGCDRTFIVQHELVVENRKLRASPGYDGMYHDITSACYGEFSLELAPHQPQLEPGSLAFTIEPHELPKERDIIGRVTLPRKERRKRARAISGRGRRFARAYGRGHARHVLPTETVYSEPTTRIPEVLRIPVPRTLSLQGPHGLSRIRNPSMYHVDHRCYQFKYVVGMCDGSCCGAKIVATTMLYATTDPRKHDGVRRALNQLWTPVMRLLTMRLHELDMGCWRCSKHNMGRYIDRSRMR